MANPSHTCITCSVAFEDADQQRDHYKNDWHRYNLKRKVTELPPISFSDFKVRVEKQKKDTSKDTQKSSGYCVSCSKNFTSEKAYVNHVKSKKHLEMVALWEKKENKEELLQNRKNLKMARDEKRKEAEEMEVEEVDSDEWEDDEDDPEFEDDPIPLNLCLFCRNRSKNLEKNLMHMSEDHSFFLPDAEFITDVEGLVEYLGAKVGQGHVCLWCDEKSKEFRSISAVQKHMVDKGHCKILYESDGLAEFADYYDYSKSYPDQEIKDSDEEDEGEEAEVDLDRLDDTGYELILPSGAKVGHRSLMRYYRQSLPPERAVVAKTGMGKVLSHYKNFGWVGISTPEAKKKERDLKFMRKIQQKSWMRLGTKANKLQKHWRDPTMLY